MSIPRLELTGALAGLRLTLKICAALEIPRNKATFWVDSVNVGFWVQGQSRNFKPFVSHRVGEIHDESSPDQWRYVPTKLNPADQGTRGPFVQELATDDCWWQGPSFLQYGEDEWPERKFGKRQKLTRKLSRRNEDSLRGTSQQQCTELLCGNSQIKGRTRPNGLFKMVPDPVKRKARDRDLFGTGDRLD